MKVILYTATLMAVATCFLPPMPIKRIPLVSSKSKLILPRLFSSHDGDTSALFFNEYGEPLIAEDASDSDLFAQEVVESRYISSPKSALFSPAQGSVTATRQLTVEEKVYDSLKRLQTLLLAEDSSDGQSIAKLQLRLLTNMIKSDIQN